MSMVYQFILQSMIFVITRALPIPAMGTLATTIRTGMRLESRRTIMEIIIVLIKEYVLVKSQCLTKRVRHSDVPLTTPIIAMPLRIAIRIAASTRVEI
jgi:hypothetical protein